MKTLHYIPILIILFLSACTSDETLTPPEPDGQGNVTFLFTTGSEITTRTELNSSKNLQHVEKVHLYIFKGIGDAATCEQVKELPWPKPGDVNYATTTRTYSILLPSGDYTFLAIGLDDKSGTTYDPSGSYRCRKHLSRCQSGVGCMIKQKKILPNLNFSQDLRKLPV